MNFICLLVSTVMPWQTFGPPVFSEAVVDSPLICYNMSLLGARIFNKTQLAYIFRLKERLSAFRFWQNYLDFHLVEFSEPMEFHTMRMFVMHNILLKFKVGFSCKQ